MTDATTPAPTTRIPSWVRGGAGVIAAVLALMWLVEILDTVALDDRLQGNGIRPRSVDGIDGIVWALGNRAWVLVRGVRRWMAASAVIIVLGGALVWLLAIGSNEVHIGASGWVFGLFGFLIASAWFERRPVSIVLAIVAVMLYGGTILFGFLPRPGLSWEGHLFGFVAGVVAARMLTARRTRTVSEPTDPLV